MNESESKRESVELQAKRDEQRLVSQLAWKVLTVFEQDERVSVGLIEKVLAEAERMTKSIPVKLSSVPKV